MSGHDGLRRYVGLLHHLPVADRARSFYLRGSFKTYVDPYYCHAEYTGNRKWGGDARGRDLVIYIHYLCLCCQSRFGEDYNFPSFFNAPRIVECHNLPLSNPKIRSAPKRKVGNIGSSEVWTTAPVPFWSCIPCSLNAFVCVYFQPLAAEYSHPVLCIMLLCLMSYRDENVTRQRVCVL